MWLLQKYFLFVIITYLTFLSSEIRAEPKKELFERLIRNVLKHSSEPAIAETWFGLTDRAATEVFTLEFQHLLREKIRTGLCPEVTQEVYGQIVGRFRQRLARMIRPDNLEIKIIHKIEHQSAQKVTSLYDEMAEAFKTPDNLLNFIEENPWAKTLLTELELAQLHGVASFYRTIETPVYSLIRTTEIIHENGGKLLATEDFKTLEKIKVFLDERDYLMASVDDVRRVGQKKGWFKEGLLTASELNILRRIQILVGLGKIDRYSLPEHMARRTFQSLEKLTQREVFREIRRVATASREGMKIHPEIIERIFRNFSEQHQVIWSLAEARLALKMGYHFWNFWKSYISKSPSLKRRWFCLHLRAKKLLLPRRLPNDPAEVAEFFQELTTLLAEAIHGQPRLVLKLPTPSYLDHMIERHAQILVADFKTIRLLWDVSPDIGISTTLLEEVRRVDSHSSLRILEEVFDRGGPIEMIQKLKEIEGGYHIIPWDGLRYSHRNLFFGMARIPTGFHRRERGQHFRRWLGENISFGLGTLVTSIMAVDLYAAWTEYKELQPPFRSDRFTDTQNNGGSAPVSSSPADVVHGGIRPPREEKNIGETFLQHMVEQAILKLRKLEVDLTKAQNPTEISHLKDDIRETREELFIYLESDLRMQEILRHIQVSLKQRELKVEERLSLDKEKPENQSKIDELDKEMIDIEAQLDVLQHKLDQVLDGIISEIYQKLTLAK